MAYMTAGRIPSELNAYLRIQRKMMMSVIMDKQDVSVSIWWMMMTKTGTVRWTEWKLNER